MTALSMDDLAIRPGQRGTILGETQTGKSTLAEHLIGRWRDEYPRSFTLIADTKPRFKASRELDGRPTSVSGRYRRQDWGEEIPNSVVLPMRGIAQLRSDIKMARSLKYNVAIVQIPERNYVNIMWCAYAIRFSYDDRPPKRPLLIYVDELNNFFRDAPRAASEPIKMVITSGAERSVGFLGAAQRPRNISVEAMESMTKLYWFYSSYSEDVKHLRAMGVPPRARPAPNYYQFYFFDKYTRRDGLAQLQLARPTVPKESQQYARG